MPPENPVVKHVDEVELRVVVAAVLTVAPKPFSSHSTFEIAVPIWLPHQPASI